MCGIFACICCSQSRTLDPILKTHLVDKLKRRGPDHTGEVSLAIGDSIKLDMLGTLLHMRGATPTPQPFRGDMNSSRVGGKTSDNLLLWNGNIFGGELQIKAEDNDTQKLYEALNETSDPSDVLLTISKIHGPWAFVYWQSETKSLWFGRDVFGRRSLLWHLPSIESKDPFLLSSVGHYHPDKMPLGYWLEVPASCVFQLKCLNEQSVLGDLYCYPWTQGDAPFQAEAGIAEELASLKTCLNIHKIDNPSLQVPFPALNRTLPPQQCLHSQPAVLTKKTVVEKNDSELSSQGSSVEHRTVRRSDLDKAPSQMGIVEDSTIQSSNEEKQTKVSMKGVLSLSEPVSIDVWSSLAKQLITILEKAVHSRIVRAPHVPSSVTPLSYEEQPPATEVSLEHHRKTDLAPGLGDESELSIPTKLDTHGKCSNFIRGRARIAILFSGGVDSMVLAALVDKCLDPSEEVDLINVAFEQKSASHSQQSETNFDVPDRISSIENLKELNPHRKWNLVMVNVTLGEVNAARKERVSQLIFPLCTVLDDSIGCAFWFAARGQGTLYNDTSTDVQASSSVYHSQARTLFVGVGADEQLAGYSRHRTKFRAFGWAGLVDEVEMDVKRLARRNLGRDDRCIADHQREGQFPFLDEQVVAFLQQLPIHFKVDLELPRGLGEKRLLRETAAILGCHGASKLPKRAIQFGSRMAKLAGSSNSRELGSDVCQRLLPQV